MTGNGATGNGGTTDGGAGDGGTTDWGTLAATRLAALAETSAAGTSPDMGVTRLPFTPEHRAALDLLTGWMRTAGLTPTLDAAGTLVGRLDGPPGAGTFYMGSHQDSVPGGGAFDGIMGVVLPLLALEKLRAEGLRLPFAVEVLAFADEEGVRFPTALVGSRALAGTVDPAVLALKDEGGIPLATAMTRFGLDPAAIPDLARDPATTLGFLETHIEQGPVLEDADTPLGVVTAINGIERHAVTVTGITGHAGTLPMATRRDALVGAAALVTEVNRLGLSVPGLTATVGALTVHPNAVNAVPREVRLTAELRAPDDTTRTTAGAALHTFAADLATRSGLTIAIEKTYQQPAVPCDARLTETLAAAIGPGALHLPSGATHDASAMADLGPIAMLFVRCAGGISHDPAEHASPADMGAAVTVLANFLKSMRPNAPGH